MRTRTKRAKLREALEREVEEWNQKQHAELVTLDFPVVYEKTISGVPSAYQVEVELLQKNEQYVYVAISVDDGGINAFFPPTSSLIIRAPATGSSN